MNAMQTLSTLAMLGGNSQWIPRGYQPGDAVRLPGIKTVFRVVGADGADLILQTESGRQWLASASAVSRVTTRDPRQLEAMPTELPKA